MNEFGLGLAVKAKTLILTARESVERNEEKFFSQKNKAMFFAFFALATFLLVPDTAMAANPLETMKNVYVQQAEGNAFPVLIMWTLILGVVISFAMGKFMPFILAVIASVIIALTPQIAPNFTAAEFNAS